MFNSVPAVSLLPCYPSQHIPLFLLKTFKIILYYYVVILFHTCLGHSSHHRTFILIYYMVSHAGHTCLGHFTFYILFFIIPLMCMILLLQCMSRADLGGPIDPFKKFETNLILIMLSVYNTLVLLL